MFSDSQRRLRPSSLKRFLLGAHPEVLREDPLHHLQQLLLLPPVFELRPPCLPPGLPDIICRLPLPMAVTQALLFRHTSRRLLSSLNIPSDKDKGVRLLRPFVSERAR